MKNLFTRHTLLFALTAFFVLLSSACKTTEDDNLTERPWNTPKSWESGIPTGMMQGR